MLVSPSLYVRRTRASEVMGGMRADAINESVTYHGGRLPPRARPAGSVKLADAPARCAASPYPARRGRPRPGLERLQRPRIRPRPQRLRAARGTRSPRRGGAGPPRQGRAVPRRAAGRLLRDEPHPRRPAACPRTTSTAPSRRSSRACGRPSTSSCTAAGYGCEASHLVARKLKERGIPAVVLNEGWPAWTDAGYPIKEGRAAVRLLRHPARVLARCPSLSAASSSTRAWTRSRTRWTSPRSSTATS